MTLTKKSINMGQGVNFNKGVNLGEKLTLTKESTWDNGSQVDSFVGTDFRVLFTYVPS